MGEVRFDESERGRGTFRVPNIVAPVRRLVTLVVIGLALLWMAPDWVGRVSRTLQERPLPSLAWGAAVTAGIAVSAAVIGALTAFAVGVLGGVTLGGLAPPILGIGILLELALLTPFLIIALYLPPILLGSIAGRWTLERYRSGWLKVPGAPLTAGLALYVIARALPLIGGLVFAGGALLGLGALAIWIRDLSSGEARKVSE